MNMKDKSFSRYYSLACIGVLVASYYPLSMGIRVITDMIVDGAVLKENYPKYIIPYTPMCIAIIIGVFLMPLCIKLFKRFALAGGASIATGIFFALELLFEQKVLVSTAEAVTKLEDWQMFMCYVPPEGWGETVTTYKTQTAVDILMGDYNPAFKLHFYIISVVLIVTILNCLYGFGQIKKNGDKKRLTSLILQSVCSLTFLGLCILACFTAFWRDGSIHVSPLSASLMTVFFVLLGVTFGVFTGSLLLGKRQIVSVVIPSVVASCMTLVMYIGEMVLLNGHLYRMGTGILFDSLPGIVFAPIDLLIILLSGCITALVFTLMNTSSRTKKQVVAISVICTAFVLGVFLALLLGGTNRIDTLDETNGAVQLTEKTSDMTESCYEVSAYLPGTDFSSIGQELKTKIAQEWETYSGMSEMQRLASSKLWGLVYIQADTWEECEKVIGTDVSNPLESIDGLYKINYFGRAHLLSTPVKHIQITANSTLTSDRSVSDMSITAGYNTDDNGFGIGITLSATLCADAGMHTTGSVSNGYATYDEDIVVTGSGIPVLIITTDEMNNNGYYNGDYFEPTAYWVQDNVFYSLRVFGDEAEKAEIQAILERILEDV